MSTNDIDQKDPLCPERRYAAGYAEEEGRQAAGLKWMIIKYGLIVLVISGAGWTAWSYVGNATAGAMEKVTPCFMSETKRCGAWAHPSEWNIPFFGDDAEEETQVAAPEPENDDPSWFARKKAGIAEWWNKSDDKPETASIESTTAETIDVAPPADTSLKTADKPPVVVAEAAASEPPKASQATEATTTEVEVASTNADCKWWKFCFGE
ncbi:MAG: hypothetical protein KC877_02145 [Candidatus Kaiserbacteria bacterium]|nr:hypothetical protein [Candidatus Kaiserbacteria bacterium]MCB9816166.1 hypothetical protein [Candidatus Nomurabacteria bacterium]